jgi:hypothetical protein
VLRQGDPSDSFLVVVEGEGAIRVESPSGEVAELGRIPQPTSLGEIGLLLGEPRTATVVAASPMTALRFSAKAFQAMFEKIPNFGEGLAAGLAHRLDQVSGHVSLPEYDLEKHPPSREALELLPMELCKRHRILPLSVKGNALTLGLVDDPTSPVIHAVHEHLPSFELESVHIDLSDFNEIVRTRAGAEGWAPAEGAAAPAPVPSPRSPRLDALLERVVAEGASDLHLAAGYKPHWRVDGDMAVIEDGPVLGPDDALELLTPVMEERHRDQFAEDNDADFAYSIPGVARFRVNLFRDHRGTGAVFRLIPSKVLTLEQLGLPPVLKNFCEMPKGLVLVTGPTGCGKSSTLAAMIDFVKKTRQTHIVTIEDPIEFVHDSGVSLINQREVGGHTKSFARALRAALREDPDIILLGEMRDLDTIALALEAANTGHLVLATLHTNSAVAAVRRGPSRRARGPGREHGRVQPHPGGQDRPDHEHHAGGQGPGDVDPQRRARHADRGSEGDDGGGPLQGRRQGRPAPAFPERRNPGRGPVPGLPGAGGQARLAGGGRGHSARGRDPRVWRHPREGPHPRRSPA